MRYKKIGLIPIQCLFFFASPHLLSATATWALTGSGNWNVNGNWSPATFPNAIDDVANLGSSITADSAITLGQDITIGTLNASSPSFTYTINTGNNLIFDVSAASALVSVTGFPLRFNCPVVFNDNIDLNITSTAFMQFSGGISGSGNINVLADPSLAGSVTFATVANSYTGTTTVSTGTFVYNVAGAIPSASVVTINGGRIVQSASMSSTNALAVTVNSSTFWQTSGNVSTYFSSLSGNGLVAYPTGSSNVNVLTFTGAAPSTFGGTFNGGSGSTSTDPSTGSRIVKEGAQTLILTGNSSGGLNSRVFISEGVIHAQNGGALGNAATTNAVYVLSGTTVGSLYVSNNITLTKNLFLNGAGYTSTGALRNFSGTNTVSGTIQLGWSGGSETSSPVKIQVDSTSLTLSNVVSGLEPLTKTGAGTLILSGANTYSGGTTVSSGVLQGTTTSLQGNITNNASVIFTQAVTGTYSGIISGTGSVTKQSAGTLILTGANIYSGGTTVSAGVLQGDATSLQGNIANSANVTFDQASTGTYAGIISLAGSVTKINTGTLILTGANTYSGEK